MEARIVIDSIEPRTLTGEYPAKAVIGETVPVSADIYKEGHDIIAARVRWRPAAGMAWQAAPLTLTENDRWVGTLSVDHVGMHEFVVESWLDVYATWRHKTEVKLEALQDVGVELQEGNLFFAQRSKEAGLKAVQEKLLSVSKMLLDESLDQTSRVHSAMTDEIVALVDGPGKTDHITTSQPMKLWVDRERAGFGSWYCAFPRSFGGLRGLADNISYISNMNFDVLYLTPIHPIGQQYRKGKNNTLDPTPDDVGSPYAIGSPDGGHLDIEPSIGTLDDFHYLVKQAAAHGVELALDNALQCSPDHPWVKEHPEWFHHRPDGSIAYAENPPKKYQDIYPINFWPEKETDREALWEACRETFTYWIGHGVKIFRVDNPHTKPMAFWAWCISTIQAEHPDVIFLSEAFTRPKVMAKLAEVGFSQSYTYFTWRLSAEELTEYGVEVSVGPSSSYMRPNFWPNTHDILLPPLRWGGVGAFKNRMLLAATMVPNYGIYSGYELMENEPLDPAKNTDYLHSEKYEVKQRDFGAENSLAPWIAHINQIRRNHPALQEQHNIWFHGADNDQIIAFSKRSSDGADAVLVVINIDSDNTHQSMLHLDLARMGVDHERPFEVFDEITGRTFNWWGSDNYVLLSPNEPGHILQIRQ